MPAASAEISVGIPCNLRVGLGNRFDRDLSRLNKLIKSPAGDRIVARINDNRSFYVINSTYAAVAGVCDRSGAKRSLFFVAKNRDDR